MSEPTPSSPPPPAVTPAEPRAGTAAAAPPSRAVVAIVLAIVALRIVHWLFAPPNSDEAYYWAWGQHPALSYYDHPPLLAWTQGLLHAALGRSLFVLRLPAALCTVGTVLLVARLAGKLAGPERGRLAWAAAALFASPLLMMFSAFAWHDALLIFFTALSGSLLADFLAEVAAGGRGSTARLFLGAAALGVAALAKYNAVFAAVGVALAISWDARLRRLFLDWRLWVAAAITVAVLSPILVWNLDHGLASFRFHLVQRQRLSEGIRLRPMAIVHFLVPTILLISPPLAVAMVEAFRRPRPTDAPDAPGTWPAVYRRTALAVFAASTAAFLGMSLFTWTLYYWNIVAYVLLVAPAAVVLSARPRLLRWHLGYGLVLATVAVLHAAVIPLTAYFPSIQDDDSKEPYGWTEIAQAVRAELGRAPGRFPATTDYRSASHLAWALGTADVVVVSPHRSQFDYWLDPAHAGATAVLVTDHREPMNAGVAARFERVTHVATLPVERLGVRVKSYELWVADGFRPPASAPGP